MTPQDMPYCCMAHGNSVDTRAGHNSFTTPIDMHLADSDMYMEDPPSAFQVPSTCISKISPGALTLHSTKQLWKAT